MLDPENRGTDLLINFGAAGNGAQFQRFGWSAAEPRHTWTIGWLSRLEFSRPAIPGTYLMLLQIGPFIWGRLQGQRLCVLVNEREVGRFVISEVSAVECIIPWPLLAEHERVSVMFCHPDAAVPKDVTDGRDSREIALAFEMLALFHQSALPEGARESAGVADDGEQLSPAELMMQFESLGQNCEFGLVQRRCGAEPLGLLRFASTPLPALLTGLAARFEGLGDPGQLEIQVASGEYLVIDGRFGILYHAWVKVGEAEPDYIRHREERRLPFLRQKLIEDLEEGRKLFVYHGMEKLPRPQLLRLALAIRAYGPATLLWVELADETHPVGTVEPITRGLLKGYVDRFAPGENAYDLSLDSWIAVCRNAYRLARRIGR